jgi:hypothetical protein
MNPSDNGDDENLRDFYDLDDLEFSERGRLPKWPAYALLLMLSVGGWFVFGWLITCVAGD